MVNQIRPNWTMVRWFRTDLLKTKDAASAREAPNAKKYPVDWCCFIYYIQTGNCQTII